MRSKAFRMNPEDLEKYGDNKADERLRAALKQASDSCYRAIHKLITGIYIPPLPNGRKILK